MNNFLKGENFRMKFFKNLEAQKTNVKTEIMAGLTTFFAIAYIIIVNSETLSLTGMPRTAAIFAIVFASAVGCFIMAFYADSPIILVPGLGECALFVFTICGKDAMGLSLSQGLAAIFISGILFSIIAFTKLGQILTEAIPEDLKTVIIVGIGLFLTFIGLRNGGIVVASPATMVGLGDFGSVRVIVTLINLGIALFLFSRNIPGGFLISLVLGTVVGIVFGIVDISSISFDMPSISEYSGVFFNMDFSGLADPTFWVAVFSLVLLVTFENLGLMYGQTTNMIGAPEKFKNSFRGGALSVITCGIFGSSPTIDAIETGAGIAAGGRTGLTALTTGILFLLSLLFTPLIMIIPSEAIAPILIIIGFLMVSNISRVDFGNFEIGFPCFLILSTIPLTFSIVDGIALGFIAYPLVMIFKGKAKEVKIPMYVVSLIFVLSFVLKVIA